MFCTMYSLDKTDTKLLQALSADPRSTFVALADTLGLSRNTVQARMKRLEDSGAFLGFDRRINPAALGYPLTAFIEVHVQQKRLAQIVIDLALIPELVQARGELRIIRDNRFHAHENGVHFRPKARDVGVRLRA